MLWYYLSQNIKKFCCAFKRLKLLKDTYETKKLDKVKKITVKLKIHSKIKPKEKN